MRRDQKRLLPSAELLLSLLIILLLVVLGGFVWLQRDAIFAIGVGLGEETEQAPAPAPPREDGAPTVPSEAGPPTQTSISGTDDVARPSVPADVGTSENAARAMLREEQRSDDTVVTNTGISKWHVELGNNGGDRVTVDVSIPERSLDLVITLYENQNDALPASHLMEVRIRSSAFDITEVGRPYLKKNLQAQGEGLIGAATKIQDGLFLVALSSDSRDVDFNMYLLRALPLIDLPIVYVNGERAILTIEKGDTGERAIQQVLAAGNGQ